MDNYFENLFSVNNRHPLIDLSTSAVRCLKCYEAIVVLPDDKNSLTELSASNYNDFHIVSSVHTSNHKGSHKNHGKCKCGNLACMLDTQSTLRVYVADIRTVHLGYAILNKQGDVLRTVFQEYSESLVYVPYKDLKDLPLLCTSKQPSKVLTKKPTKVLSLVDALDLSAQGVSRTFFYDTKD